MANAAEAIQENFEEQGGKITAVEQNIDDLGSLARNGSLADGSNLNDIESGIWAVYSSRTYTNLPSGLTTGVLFVMPTDSGAYLAQIFIGATGIRSRLRTRELPGTWWPWTPA